MRVYFSHIYIANNENIITFVASGWHKLLVEASLYNQER